MASKIENVIKEIELLVNNATPYGFSKENVIIKKDEIAELVQELGRSLPEEILHCQRMIRNESTITKNAEEKARQIIENATKESSLKVLDSEVVREANVEAERIRNEAYLQSEMIKNQSIENARNINLNAMRMYDKSLEKISEEIIQSTQLLETKAKEFYELMQSKYNEIQNLRNELAQSMQNNLRQ
jgi:cell division septum initiation protein DivIVA